MPKYFKMVLNVSKNTDFFYFFEMSKRPLFCNTFVNVSGSVFPMKLILLHYNWIPFHAWSLFKHKWREKYHQKLKKRSETKNMFYWFKSEYGRSTNKYCMESIWKFAISNLKQSFVLDQKEFQINLKKNQRFKINKRFWFEYIRLGRFIGWRKLGIHPFYSGLCFVANLKHFWCRSRLLLYFTVIYRISLWWKRKKNDFEWILANFVKSTVKSALIQNHLKICICAVIK